MLASLVACGSSSDDGDDKGGGSPGVSKADLAELEKKVEEKVAAPTSINLDTPLAGDISTLAGKTVALMMSSNSSNQDRAKVMEEQFKLIGMVPTIITYGGEASELTNAYDRLLTEDYDAVVTSDIQERNFPKVYEHLEAKNVPIIETAAVDEPTSDNVVSILRAEDGPGTWTRLMVDYALVDSDGEANMVFASLPEFESVRVIETGVSDEAKQYCPSCGFDILPIKSTDIGEKSTAAIVAFLQSHPDVNYVLTACCSMAVGLPAALRNAGLEDQVQIVTNGSGPADLEYLKDGQTLASTAYSEPILAMMNVDAVARYLLGEDVSVDADWEMPIQILTEDNLDFDVSETYVGYEGYEEDFHKLWGISS